MAFSATAPLVFLISKHRKDFWKLVEILITIVLKMKLLILINNIKLILKNLNKNITVIKIVRML